MVDNANRAAMPMSIARRWLFMAFAVTALGLGLSRPIAAAEQRTICPICQRATDNTPDYGTKAGATFVRGATNLLFGWTEVIRQPAEEAREGRTVRTVIVGMADGVGKGIARTAVGIGELLTFWTPKVNSRYVYLATDCPICMGRKTDKKP